MASLVAAAADESLAALVVEELNGRLSDLGWVIAAMPAVLPRSLTPLPAPTRTTARVIASPSFRPKDSRSGWMPRSWLRA